MMYFYVTASKKPYRFVDTAKMCFFHGSIFVMNVYGRAFYVSTPPPNMLIKSTSARCKLTPFLDRLKDDPVEFPYINLQTCRVGVKNPNYHHL